MTKFIKVLLIIVLIPCAAYSLLLISFFVGGLTYGLSAVSFDQPCERDRAGYCVDGRP